jgi:putative FmdB family regulatory protein
MSAMPTYDYQCDACGHQFEEFQNITAPVLTKCPACKKKKLRRLFGTGAAVVFKGSGFYQTDYRSEGYKKAAKNDSSGEGGKSDTGSSKDSGSSSSASDSSAKSADSKSAKADAAKPKTGKSKD